MLFSLEASASTDSGRVVAAAAPSTAKDATAAEEALLFQRMGTLNEKGILWLRHCLNGGGSSSIHRALLLFRAALKCTREFLEVRSISNSSNKNRKSNKNNNNNTVVRDQLLFHDQEGMQLNTWDLDSQPAIVENVIVRPFHLIPSLTSGYSSDPLVNASISFALLMFNTGITHHLQAIITGAQDQEIVRDTLPCQDACSKARMLYEQSLNVLEKVRILCPPSIPRSPSCGLAFSYCAVTDLLRMALYNNLFRVAISMTDYIAAKRHSHIFQRLCSYLQNQVSTFYPDDPMTQGIVLNCARSLWLNTQEPYFLHEPTVASAA